MIQSFRTYLFNKKSFFVRARFFLQTCLLFICLCHPGISQPKQPNRIQYVGNMGVLIHIDGVQIIVDGLHLKYEPDYQEPPLTLLDSIVESKGDYKIDYVLVTHVHGDHFHKTPVSQLLLKNKQVQVIAPRQVVDSLRTLSSFPLFAHRVIEAKDQQTTRTIIRNTPVSITANTFLHTWQQRHRYIQNIAYEIGISKYKILHVGDGDVQESTLSNSTFLTTAFDFTIVPDWFFMGKTTSLTKKYLKSREVILTHINPLTIDRSRIYQQADDRSFKLTPFYIIGQFKEF